MCLSKMEQSVLQELYDFNRIPTFILTDTFSIAMCFSDKPSTSLKHLLAKQTTTLTQQLHKSDLHIFRYENELYYIIPFKRSHTAYYLLAGPMPVISLSAFSFSVRILTSLLADLNLTEDEILHHKFYDVEGQMQKNLIYELFEKEEELRVHTPYREELAILNCVKEGDLNRLKSTYSTLPETKYGTMSQNPLKQLFYGCIANTTLVTRYAIEGGVNEETAFTLSDVYIQQMEKCQTLYELTTLNENMVIAFTKLTAKARAITAPPLSTPVSQCKDFILKHLHQKITLSTLGAVTGLSPKYISYLFKQEMSETISSYIERKRIDEAKDLLSLSSMSYSQIAHSLCFSSQSYFTSVFKRYTKMTPKEFRTSQKKFPE